MERTIEMQPVLTKTLETIALHVNVEVNDIDCSTKLESLGLDSLGVVELIFALEEAFDITLPFNANTQAEDQNGLASATLGEIAQLVSQLLDARQLSA